VRLRLFFTLFAWLCVAPMALAEPASDIAASAAEDNTGLPFPTTTSHMILLDYDTGTVLAQRKADEKMFPSSMTKLMTLYLIFEQLKQGSLSLTDQFTVSEKAWSTQGSKMFVPLGEQILVQDLIRGIAIQSGNDACIVMAEGLAGSEEAFATRMNETAKKLGMTGTHFVNANGWPDENHYTTARDLSILAKALIQDFPDYYHYFSKKEFTYNGIRQFHRNVLLNRPGLGVDGLKTGHTDIAGYGIVLSAKQAADNRRVVLVVNGLKSEKIRAQEGEAILSWGMRNFVNQPLLASGQQVGNANVWLGDSETVPVMAGENVVLTVSKQAQTATEMTITLTEPVAAPINKGQQIGTGRITLASGETREVPLLAANDVAKKGAFARIPDVIGHWLGL
jgi:serine-type D-Ala-D-Ala carboxypeptidase (penicillin-binding protein 5/6)